MASDLWSHSMETTVLVNTCEDKLYVCRIALWDQVAGNDRFFFLSFSCCTPAGCDKHRLQTRETIQARQLMHNNHVVQIGGKAERILVFMLEMFYCVIHTRFSVFPVNAVVDFITFIYLFLVICVWLHVGQFRSLENVKTSTLGCSRRSLNNVKGFKWFLFWILGSFRSICNSIFVHLQLWWSEILLELFFLIIYFYFMHNDFIVLFY